MFQLINNFVNGSVQDRVISQHRTLVAAMKANQKLQRQIEKSNGKGSYLPTRILANWQPCDEYEWDQALIEVNCR